MWRDELGQGFLTNGRRLVTAWYHYQRIGSLTFLGAMMVVAISPVEKALPYGIAGLRSPAPTLHTFTALSTDRQFEPVPTMVVQAFPDILPPVNLPINQGGVVNVPPVNRPQVWPATVPTLETPPAVLPPTVFSTNQTPTVSVPPLQPLPTQTPTPVTTSQPLERLPESGSPAIISSPVIEFGQPLPKTNQ
jgi:hypothetical protein